MRAAYRYLGFLTFLQRLGWDGKLLLMYYHYILEQSDYWFVSIFWLKSNEYALCNAYYYIYTKLDS